MDDSAYDNTIFTFDNSIPSISVSTSLLANIKLHKLKITGTLGTWGSATAILNVNIVHGCTLTVITTDSIAPQEYLVTDSALTFTFTEW